MNEVDENGWSHVHHAANKGYFKSVEKFIKANDTQLEFETEDEYRETPLLIAAKAGIINVDTVNILIELGANLSIRNSHNHGIVELCCLHGHTELLEHLVKINNAEIPVWKNVLKFCSSEKEEDAASAGSCLSVLTQSPDGQEMNPHWKPIYDHGAVPVLIKVIKSAIGEKAKVEMLKCLVNLLPQDEVKTQVSNSGGIETFIRLVKSPVGEIIKLASVCLALICKVKQYAETAAAQGALASLVAVLTLEKQPEADVIVELVNAIGVICDSNETRQTLLFNTRDGLQSICRIVQEAYDAAMIHAATQALGRVCRHHDVNQRTAIQCNVTGSIIALVNMKNKELQLCAVDTLHQLVDGNVYTQQRVMNDGAINPLMTLLKRSKDPQIQEKTASALWALAGNDGEERRTMAMRIQVILLIDFLGSLSEILHFIGSEGLGVLAQGAHNCQDEIADSSGVVPLVRLLKSDKEHLVLSAIRSIRHMCLSLGYIPHTRNQNTVAAARGVKILIALTTLSKSELIQVEAALSLAAVSLGNPEVMEEIWSPAPGGLEFSYVRVLKLLYSDNDVVRLIAGSALATFAFNNMAQQQTIAAEGGIRFSCFLDFLQSDDEFFRCSAAFQVVVLSRIIPDEEQAVTSAAGIKLITDILNESKSPVTQALAADCVARLAHTRAGVPSAFVEVSAVDKLCDLLVSPTPQVRGSAAVALAFLSHTHRGERKLLNRCRVDPYLMKCIMFYVDKERISSQFTHEWQHYKRIGLPPIDTDRPALVSQVGHHLLPIDSGDIPRHSGSKSNLNHSSHHSSRTHINTEVESRISHPGADERLSISSHVHSQSAVAVE